MLNITIKSGNAFLVYISKLIYLFYANTLTLGNLLL